MRAACAMDDNRKTVALLCLKYQGGSFPLEGPFLGLDATKYRKICIYLKTDANLPTPVEEKGCHSYYMSLFPCVEARKSTSLRTS